MPRKHKKLGGGIFDSLGQTLSNLTNSISQGTQTLVNKAKQSLSSNQYQPSNSSYASTPSYASTTSYQTPTNNYGSTNYGGTKPKTRRRNSHRKHKRGGSFRDNISLTNLASHAAPFSGNTAQPHNWVGGRTRRHRNRRSKSRRTR
jgi:hypothetical protein